MHRRLTAGLLAATLTAGLALAGPAVAGAKTLVSYEQSGGIAGIMTGVSVTELGGVRATTSRSAGIKRFRLSAAELRALKRDLRDAGFSKLRSLYDSKVPVADGISQTVRYAGFRVTVSTGGRPPERLRKVLSRLGAIAARSG